MLVLEEQARQLGARGDTELPIDVSQVVVHGAGAQEELCRDVAVA